MALVNKLMKRLRVIEDDDDDRLLPTLENFAGWFLGPVKKASIVFY